MQPHKVTTVFHRSSGATGATDRDTTVNDPNPVVIPHTVGNFRLNVAAFHVDESATARVRRLAVGLWVVPSGWSRPHQNVGSNGLFADNIDIKHLIAGTTLDITAGGTNNPGPTKTWDFYAKTYRKLNPGDTLKVVYSYESVTAGTNLELNITGALSYIAYY